MYRAIPIGNRLCERRNEQRRQDLHREKIRTMRPHIDTQEPKSLHLDHIRNNLKREQLLEERYGEIDRENRILLQKMSDIMRNPTGAVPAKSQVQSSSAKGAVSLNKDKRKRDLMRITNENQAILKRIQRAQPAYNHVKWEESHRRNQEYLRNCCEYPLVLRKGTLGSPSASLGGTTLMGSSSPGDLEGTGKLADYGKKDPGDLKYLLKEGKKIGEAYYLVEMATDGRTLTISAYDGDTQKTLELLINEKNHRRLYRECNGDYGTLGNRLRVEGDRLSLADTNPLGTSGVSGGLGHGGGGAGTIGGQHEGGIKRGEHDGGITKTGQHVEVNVGRDGTGGVKLK